MNTVSRLKTVAKKLLKSLFYNYRSHVNISYLAAFFKRRICSLNERGFLQVKILRYRLASYLTTEVGVY